MRFVFFRKLMEFRHTLVGKFVNETDGCHGLRLGRARQEGVGRGLAQLTQSLQSRLDGRRFIIILAATRESLLVLIKMNASP